jgi:hypothetical protein
MAQKKPTNWVGWVFFAGAMMILVGALQALAGFVALFKHSYYLVTNSGLIAFNYTAWGWIDIVIGVVILLAGLAVLAGKTWGRMVGVFLAILSALANLAFLSSYPIWSIIAIVIDVLVIYALTAHGEEV